MRVPVTELEFDIVEGGARLQFFLPAGAYATSLVEELRKDLWFSPAPDARPMLPMRDQEAPDTGGEPSS